MKTPLFAWILAAGLAITAGCGGTGKTTQAPPGPAQGPGETSPAAGTTEGAPQEVGEVTPALDVSQGLSGLAAYHASLRFSFEGTQAGEPGSWENVYELSAARDPEMRLLAYRESGLGAGAGAYPALEGLRGGVLYLVDQTGEPCAASFVEDYDAAGLVEPASLLPEPLSMDTGEPETLDGVETLRYRFEAAAVAGGLPAEGSGTAWVAKDGGYTLKYVLELSGGKDFFLDDREGTLRWEYQLDAEDAGVESLLPGDCPLPLPELPALSDAKAVEEFPGYLSYETASGIREAAEFYARELGGLGYRREAAGVVGAANASMVFSGEGGGLAIRIEGGQPGRVTIHSLKMGEGQAPEVEATTQPTGSGSPQERVVNALNLLLGSDPVGSMFESYHMDSHQVVPRWDESSGQVVFYENWMAVDAQGEKIHFTNRESTGGAESASEVYRIGEEEFVVENGKAEPGLGLASLAWIMWPVDPINVLAIGSMDTSAAGSEAVNGRAAEVYQLKGTSASDTTGMLSSLGFFITRLEGKVWVDAETGALLKTDVAYEVEVKDGGGTVRSTEEGVLEIEVSRVGEVVVVVGG